MGVFTPGILQLVQFTISAVISTPLSCDQSLAVFSLYSLSLLIVAILASHFSQSLPQHDIKSRTVFHPSSVSLDSVFASADLSPA